MNLIQSDINLKIELINDVPSMVGQPWLHPTLGRIDTAENILANKIIAVLDRAAPRDLADIWGLCFKMNLSLNEAITGAQGKAAGVFPVDLARGRHSENPAESYFFGCQAGPAPSHWLSVICSTCVPSNRITDRSP